VNVDGHCTLSGNLVVVAVPVVSSVDSDEVPLRRGIIVFGKYSNTSMKYKKKAVVQISVNRRKAAKIALCMIREMRLSQVALRVGPMTSRVDFLEADKHVSFTHHEMAMSTSS
jgi:hypothetical protein